jgi:peptidylprolyl isomerase
MPKGPRRAIRPHRLERVRKTAAALITLGLAALALAGCSAGPSFAGKACPTQPTSSGLKSSVTVEGDFGSEPKVKLDTPTKVPKLSVDDLIVGKGTAITAASQPFAANVVVYNGATGQRIGASSDVATLMSQSKEFASAVQCATEGSRLLVGFPAGTFADAATVGIVDVQKVFLPHAEGSLVYNDALGLPTVVRAPDGRPGIIIPDAKKPATQVTQTLIRGDGPKVTKNDVVRVQLTSVDWDTRKVLKSTWDTQAVAISGAELAGQTVGSQVLLVIPPADASQGTGSDGAGTQAIVVDILGVDTSASASSGQ